MTAASLLAAFSFLLGPTLVPDPPPYPPPYNLPSYQVNGDGTRSQCTPLGTYCWRDTTGLPSYLGPGG